MNFFETKVKYSIVSESGSEKKVSESYIVDAVSFTETEARITKEMQPFINDGFEITAIKKANYTDLIEDSTSTADKYYKCKIIFITMDEEKGKEKRISNYILVQAKDIEGALNNLKEGFRNMTVDWDSTGIVETPIMDVYKYFTEEV